MKICTKCKVNKSLDDYYNDIRTKDSRQSECKSCRILAQTKYNRSDEGKLAQAKYDKSNKGKLANARYAKSDKGKAVKAKVQVKYSKSEKGKAVIARAGHNRRINIANTLCTLDNKEFNYIIYDLQDNKCACCGKTFTKKLIPTRDHINPVKLGGDFTAFTVQALCQSCNSKKGIKYIDYRTQIHKQMIETI